MKIGGGIVLGTEASIDNDLTGKSALGLNTRGFYKINKKFGITGGFTYFFSQAPNPYKTTAYQFNFDGTYSFVNNDKIDFYGLVGFDIGYFNLKNKSNNISRDDSNVGLDLGLGFAMKNGIFFEVKAEGAFNQGQFTLGYLINL